MAATWTAEQRASLKPCPFCGGLPIASSQYVDTGSGDGATHYSVRCDNHKSMRIQAGVLGPHGYRHQDDLPTDEAAILVALNAWNERPLPNPPKVK